MKFSAWCDYLSFLTKMFLSLVKQNYLIPLYMYRHVIPFLLAVIGYCLKGWHCYSWWGWWQESHWRKMRTGLTAYYKQTSSHLLILQFYSISTIIQIKTFVLHGNRLGRQLNWAPLTMIRRSCKKDWQSCLVVLLSWRYCIPYSDGHFILFVYLEMQQLLSFLFVGVWMVVLKLGFGGHF